MKSLKEQLEILKRGAQEIISVEELSKKLEKSISTGKPLIAKLGADPSAPDIHLGHTVVLRKLKQFQDLGHQPVFLIGDFTGRVGDPTGKDKTRKILTEDEILQNAETYKNQVGKILDLNRLKIVFNSDWLTKLNFGDVLRLSSHTTIARLLEHNTFKKRFTANESIRLHEFFYPLLQAYDSIALEADVELGGSDQTFNIVMGRDLQKAYNQESQICMTVPILTGTDGKEKMSKSLGNYVGISETPQAMYHKLFNIADSLVAEYFELLTDKPLAEVKADAEKVGRGELDPRSWKDSLARNIVSQYHGMEKADAAARDERQIHLSGGSVAPEGTPEHQVGQNPIPLLDLLFESGLIPSKGEGRRLVRNGGIKINGQKKENELETIAVTNGMVLQAGKKGFRILRTV